MFLYIVVFQSATWVVTPELYPTEIRVSGNSMCVSWSRIGALLVPYLVISDAPVAAVGVVLGVLNIIAAATNVLLPETAGQSLGESRQLLGPGRDRVDRMSKSSRASSNLIPGVYFSASSKDHSEGSDGLLDSARDPLLA